MKLLLAACLFAVFCIGCDKNVQEAHAADVAQPPPAVSAAVYSV